MIGEGDFGEIGGMKIGRDQRNPLINFVYFTSRQRYSQCRKGIAGILM
jgi:hypothetical protein